mmetsp:Transcript_20378/g.51448  ORF Transcript_20378/g.51448 Transcript_20378/m.51448 type:complete len:224 (-) Transcript_20378:107-778(-)
MLKSMFGSNQKTFRPKKHFAKGTKLHQLHKYAKANQKATLGAGDLQGAVMLPEGEDKNEWLAVCTLDFFNQINLLYGAITEFCTNETCSCMTAGPQYEYHWADGVTVKTPIKCSAPEYVGYLMEWVQKQLEDPAIFPIEIGKPFPKDYEARVKNIFKRLFRVYAHMYHSHVESVVAGGLEPHLNTCFKHFMCFITEFSLIERKELEPLTEICAGLGMPLGPLK